MRYTLPLAVACLLLVCAVSAMGESDASPRGAKGQQQRNGMSQGGNSQQLPRHNHGSGNDVVQRRRNQDALPRKINHKAAVAATSAAAAATTAAAPAQAVNKAALENDNGMFRIASVMDANGPTNVDELVVMPTPVYTAPQGDAVEENMPVAPQVLGNTSNNDEPAQDTASHMHLQQQEQQQQKPAVIDTSKEQFGDLIPAITPNQPVPDPLFGGFVIWKRDPVSGRLVPDNWDEALPGADSAEGSFEPSVTGQGDALFRGPAVATPVMTTPAAATPPAASAAKQPEQPAAATEQQPAAASSSKDASTTAAAEPKPAGTITPVAQQPATAPTQPEPVAATITPTTNVTLSPAAPATPATPAAAQPVASEPAQTAPVAAAPATPVPAQPAALPVAAAPAAQPTTPATTPATQQSPVAAVPVAAAPVAEAPRPQPAAPAADDSSDDVIAIPSSQQAPARDTPTEDQDSDEQTITEQPAADLTAATESPADADDGMLFTPRAASSSLTRAATPSAAGSIRLPGPTRCGNEEWFSCEVPNLCTARQGCECNAAQGTRLRKVNSACRCNAAKGFTMATENGVTACAWDVSFGETRYFEVPRLGTVDLPFNLGNGKACPEYPSKVISAIDLAAAKPVTCPRDATFVRLSNRRSAAWGTEACAPGSGGHYVLRTTLRGTDRGECRSVKLTTTDMRTHYVVFKYY